MRSGLTPTAIEFMDRSTLTCVRDLLPFKLAPEVTALLLFMVDGHPHDVAGRVRRLGEICRTGGATTVIEAGDAAEADRLWAARRVISPATFKIRPNKVSEDVAVPLGGNTGARGRGGGDRPGAGSYDHLLRPRRGRQHPREHHVRPAAAQRAGGGAPCRGRPVCPGGEATGTLSGEHGIGLTKAPYIGMELSAASMALQQRLKRAFDPNGIMNPGKIFPPGK